MSLGIGASTTVFSFVDAVLLMPLPYSDPASLVTIFAERPGTSASYSFPRFTEFSGSSTSFREMAAFTDDNLNLTGSGNPEQLAAARISWNFFHVLGCRPAMGRDFVSEEDQPGGRAVVIISHSLWMRRFGGDASALGQTVVLDSRDFTVIGVLPADFRFGLLGPGIDVWTPRVFEVSFATAAQVKAGTSYLSAVARLRPGVAMRQAQSEMDVLNQRYRQAFAKMPDADPTIRIVVDRLANHLVKNTRLGLLVLAGAVGMLLAIACANVSSLLLSQAIGREREIAIRMAVGASRGRIIRQLLTEAVLLALVSGGAGLLVSLAAAHGLAALLQNTVPRAHEIRVDGHVLAFAIAVSWLTGLLFGMAPAVRLAGADLNTALRSHGKGAAGGRRRDVARNVLVTLQVAASVILLAGAGLLVNSFVRLEGTHLGFTAGNVLTMNIALPQPKYAARDETIAFYDRVRLQVGGLPQVLSVALSSALPLSPRRFSPVLLEGQPVLPIAERPLLVIETISPEYPRALQIRFIRGREFNARDNQNFPRVAIVNETLVRRFWPNEQPIGKRMHLGRMKDSTEVVGVIGDVKNIALAADTMPEVYLPLAQLPVPSMNLIVRTAVDPHRLVAGIRQSVTAIDRDQPVTAVQTLDELMRASMLDRRFLVSVLVFFSISALILAVAGIYGVIACSVAQRTQELGIRMALGAVQADILRLVVSRGLCFTGAGIAIGVASSLLLTRLISTLLYNVRATDPYTFAATAGLFAVIALLATFFPARRAIQMDPMSALRLE